MQGKKLGPEKVEISSAQILQAMKKRPYSQIINGVEYTFSILNKKQQTFVMTHERFLILKGV
jgi:regulatory protein YycI of two-component signal transduction system YycFG